jgi:hypothetical protein
MYLGTDGRHVTQQVTRVTRVTRVTASYMRELLHCAEARVISEEEEEDMFAGDVLALVVLVGVFVWISACQLVVCVLACGDNTENKT